MLYSWNRLHILINPRKCNIFNQSHPKTMLKKTNILSLAGLLLIISAMISPDVMAQQSETYFPYPTVPDSMKTLQSRCDYLVHHFWDYCDMKKGFSSRKKMEQSFADYIAFMPYATRDSIEASIKAVMKRIEKQPSDILFILDCAEGQLTGDSCQFQSEELYAMFLKAGLANKRIDKANKARLTHKLKLLENSMVGHHFPDLEYITRFGANASMANDTADIVLVMFSDPTCDDCRTARIRLDADIKTGILIKRRILRIVCLTPDEFSEEWQEAVKDYPDFWSVGACPEADMTVEIPTYPTFYFLDQDHNIIAKDLTVDQVLEALSRL